MALLVALPLMIGEFPGSELVRSLQPASLHGGPVADATLPPIDLPPAGRIQAEQQAIGAAGPSV